MADADELKRMISSFRVSELQLLCGYAGKSRTGRKSDLLARALPIAEKPTQYLASKVLELYRKRITCGMQTPTQLAPSTSLAPAPLMGIGQGYIDSLDVPSAYSPIATPPLNLISLPFYDRLDTLLSPRLLVPVSSSRYQDTSVLFHLVPRQIQEINASRDARTGESCVQIQLRLCSVVDGVDDQEDCFPPNICVRTNGKVASLPNPIPTNKPNVEPKRPPRPVNITGLCRLIPALTNSVSISWTHEQGKNFCCAIYLVRKVTSQVLLQRLKDRGMQSVEATQALIRAKLVHDEDVIATTSLRVSLLCPLGKMKQTLPCRSVLCKHVQCFDALTFLMMNEKKATWLCPVCDGPAAYGTLRLDGLFTSVIRECIDSDEVVFTEDGRWKSYKDNDEVMPSSSTKAATAAATFAAPTAPVPALPREVKTDPEGQPGGAVVDLTLDSSDDDTASANEDDDDDDEPVCKRRLLTTNCLRTLPSGMGSSSSSNGSATASGGSSVLSLSSSGAGSTTQGSCLAQSMPSYSSLVYDGLPHYTPAALALNSRNHHGIGTPSAASLIGSSLTPQQQQPLPPLLNTPLFTMSTPGDIFETFGISLDPYETQPQDLSNKGHSSRIGGSTNGLLCMSSAASSSASISRAPQSHSSSYTLSGGHSIYADDVIPLD